MDNDQIWQAVLGEIELNLSKANFTTWFKNTFISSINEEGVVVCVPNTFTKAWLEKKYHERISNALEEVIKQEIKKIIYKVEIKKQNPVSALIKKITNTENPVERITETPQRNTNKFGLNNKYVFDKFIVGKGNELAYAASQAVAANPGHAYNPLFIYGDVGLGKTHLLQAVGHEISKKTDKIMYVTSEKFTNDYIQSVRSGQAKDFKEKYRKADLLLIDDIQFMAGKDGTQEEFFHTFNELHQGDKQIILTSDRPPKAIPALEKRLLSRFEWGMIVDVAKPDVETRTAILEAKSLEKKYNIDRAVIEYIAGNIENNIRELEGALNRVIAYHEFNNTTPTVDSTKSVLGSLISNLQSKSTTTKDILNSVAKYYDVGKEGILGKSRKKELVTPRQVIMYLMREELSTSYPTIGNEIGGRDHTTAMHACNKISNEIKNNERIKQDINSIKQLIYNTNII